MSHETEVSADPSQSLSLWVWWAGGQIEGEHLARNSEPMVLGQAATRKRILVTTEVTLEVNSPQWSLQRSTQPGLRLRCGLLRPWARDPLSQAWGLQCASVKTLTQSFVTQPYKADALSIPLPFATYCLSNYLLFTLVSELPLGFVVIPLVT